ncbi:MAG: response regulator [Rhodobacterales bacterium]|nr:response regulator [Rhodobacterales bacterium]MDX5390215.1 response regulator [Rhodobacterales bacterium]MDX5489903.1 response regulator [Rhodobacterales bacterium]
MEKLQRILHVDDAEDIRMIIKISLEMIGGYHVDQFESGQDAMAGASGCNPQLFLLDFMMPDMDGMETWSALRTLPGFQDIPAIFVTAKAEENFSQNMLNKGALTVITKPFDPTELCGEIEKAWAAHLEKINGSA